MNWVLGFLLASTLIGHGDGTGSRASQAFATPDRLPELATPVALPDVHVGGWIGRRIDASEVHRLLVVDTGSLLAGYRHKPGSHPWIGEHIGKWMHAATLAWAYNGDVRLRRKLDQAVADLIATQEADGYLGTYLPAQRFGLFDGADWDVWSHKYNLIGLLTYYQYTGNRPALNACRRVGDLLVRTFRPGGRSILSAGTHMGMAATSVLEPVVLLYRFTADERYLQFAHEIVKAWDEPGGPRILDTLLTVGRVDKTANGKAYEMLSNLVGLCELARASGNQNYLQAPLNAWHDIVSKRLYITGSASRGEHFGNDFDLPNGASSSICETCVTVTWMQLNLQLLRLTGDAKFANEFEKSLYNHLAAAQNPRGDDWCYYTPLQGIKPYDSGITCCHSSGPRGLALAPEVAYLRSGSTVFVNTFESSTARLTIGKHSVYVQQASGFPTKGRSALRFHVPASTAFELRVRLAPWMLQPSFAVNSHPVAVKQRLGWAVVPIRTWHCTETVTLTYGLKAQLAAGSHGNAGLSALTFGPFVMAYDSARNPAKPNASNVGFASPYDCSIATDMSAKVRVMSAIGALRATFVPFADAGSTGGSYRVWLPAPGKLNVSRLSLLAGGHESRSRVGNVRGSILGDGDESYVVTFDGTRAELDWFGVELDKPVTVSVVEFTAGPIFHDGGWFDTRRGKPLVQVRQHAGGAWVTIAEIKAYPETTEADCSTLSDEQRRTFRVDLARRVQVVGIRVIGRPASGDNPRQAFSSCASLRAY